MASSGLRGRAGAAPRRCGVAEMAPCVVAEPINNLGFRADDVEMMMMLESMKQEVGDISRHQDARALRYSS